MVFLKNIEAVGFKSFAEKTQIEFNKGLTAVVGPNGSGKSNIIDAIRFVLGETSARSIRGMKMEDVIFNGTVTREAKNSASVTLSLDNSERTLPLEQDTVKVTRTLYRSGESEYYLNNKRVKLKDITEFFLDQGIGKNGYNIISQGEVDDILNAKPIERRTIIEEAAGVMKYKARKQESERKLDDTKQNLDRIHDIIQELEGRNNKLEMESKIAKEYLALVEEMKTSDIEVSIFDIETYLREEQALYTRYSKSEKLLEERKHHIALLDVEIEKLREKREHVSLAEREYNQEIVEKTRALEIVNGKIALFEERKSSRGQLSMDLNIEREKAEKRRIEFHEKFKEKHELIKTIRNNEKTLKDEIKSLRHNIHRLTSNDDVSVEELKDQYYALMVEKTKLENAETNQRESHNRLAVSLEEKYNRKNTLKKEMKELSETLQKNKKNHTHLVEKLNKVRTEYSDIKEKYNQANNQYDYLNENYQKAEILINQEKSKLDVLINMQENFQGYYPGVRAILRNKNNLKGIIGAVGELITTEEKYITALDTALGASSQNIVVETDNDAKRAIEFLKKERHGFATLLPLSTIVERSLSPDVERVLQTTTIHHRVLSDIVTVDKRLTKLVKHLINTTLVVKDIDDGTRLAKEIHYRARIVTLEGDTIMPGGAMSGGSKSRQNSVLKMKQDIENLKEKIVTYKQKTKELSTKLSEVKETISYLTVSLKKQEEKGIELKRSNEESTREIERLNYFYTLKEETLKTLTDELNELERANSFKDYQELIDEKQKEIMALNEEITFISDKETNREERLLNEKEQLHVKRRDLSQVETTLNYEEEQLRNIEENLEELDDTIESLNARIELAENENLELDIEVLHEDKNKLSHSLSELNRLTEELSTELDSLNTTHKKNIQLRQNYLEDTEHLQIELRELHGEREKVTAKLSQKIDYLSENYAMTFERAKELYPNKENIDEKRQRITLNKRSIEELGNVNLGSIDEFRIINERYTYLKEQEADLLEARATLLSVINEMDKEVAERFKETFELVSAQFSVVFEDMFQGGHAELKLLDETDYLNSGLEIIAQPPGKKLTSMSLMSGGERALTAISLLFSILKVKYSPFIILDEVEAALDESNVIRYADYLRRLSKDKQFIVITHRKGTMEKSDRLFGITMQENGVSELISVDLKTFVEPKRKEVGHESI